MKGNCLFCALFLILVVSISGCSNESTLFQAPPKRGESIKAPDQTESSLSISTRIPYASLKSSIDRLLPNSVNFSGSKDDCLCADHPAMGTSRQCIQVPYLDARGGGTEEQCFQIPAIVQRRACAGCNWDGSISKAGNINLTSVDNSTRVSQPLHISGRAGVGGALAQILSLSGKNFVADLNPTFDLTFDLNQDWCPVIGVNPQENWVSSASVEIIGRSCIGLDLGPLGHPQACAGPVNIDLTNQANHAISSSISSISDSIRNSIPCNAITSAVAKQWRSLSLPIKLPQGEPLYLNITPTNAAFSGFIPDASGLGITLLAKATTTLESAQISEAHIALPGLERVSPQASSLHINLPAQIPFSQLEKALAAEVKNKDFLEQTDVGKINVHVNDVSVYPSDARLVIGLNITAELPGHIFDTTGWIYLLGTPSIINDGTAISVDDISYATVLDNKLWDLVSSAFNDRIITTLKDSSTIDFVPTLREYEDVVSQQISSAKIDGFIITSKSTKIIVHQVNVYDEGLGVLLKLDGTFDATMTSIDF